MEPTRKRNRKKKSGGDSIAKKGGHEGSCAMRTKEESPTERATGAGPPMGGNRTGRKKNERRSCKMEEARSPPRHP